MEHDVLRISHEAHGTVAVVRVHGEIDMATAPALTSELAVASGTRPSRLVVDLGGVTFLSSPGLTVLVEQHKRCLASSTPMVVVATQRGVVRTLTLTGLTDLLTMAESVEEALTASP